jgi:hypothetical protein
MTSDAPKILILLLALFCAYVQWSPELDLDWVIVNGHEHYLGAPDPYKAREFVVAAIPQPADAQIEDAAPQLICFQAAPPATEARPAPLLRL